MDRFAKYKLANNSNFTVTMLLNNSFALFSLFVCCGFSKSKPKSAVGGGLFADDDEEEEEAGGGGDLFAGSSSKSKPTNQKTVGLKPDHIWCLSPFTQTPCRILTLPMLGLLSSNVQ